MVSFPLLGTMGRLGNQLFQYAFLRVTARRLGVPFYCPSWVGDQVFTLDDGAERAAAPDARRHEYREPEHRPGFHQEAAALEAGTEIAGFFQSARYYPDPGAVRRWFSLRPELAADLAQRYADIDFPQTVSLHLRFGDNLYPPDQRDVYYIAPASYYARALARLEPCAHIAVFSDDVPLARRWLAPLAAARPGPQFHFMAGNRPHEDLHLIARCRHNICSLSTLSWWGAFLNRSPHREVVVPQEGAFVPGSAWRNDDYWLTGWRECPALTDGFTTRERWLEAAWIAQGYATDLARFLVYRVARVPIRSDVAPAVARRLTPTGEPPSR